MPSERSALRHSFAQQQEISMHACGHERERVSDRSTRVSSHEKPLSRVAEQQQQQQDKKKSVAASKASARMDGEDEKERMKEGAATDSIAETRPWTEREHGMRVQSISIKQVHRP